MLEVRQSPVFTAWLAKLRDRSAAARIVARLRRFELGNLGDVEPVGEGVSEARIDYGPGYRLYFVKHGTVASSCCAAVTSDRRMPTSSERRCSRRRLR